MKHERVEVVWVDAEAHCLDWSDMEQVQEAAEKELGTMHTLGYLIHICNEHVSVLQTGSDTLGCHLFKIPRSWIVEINFLETKQKENTCSSTTGPG